MGNSTLSTPKINLQTWNNTIAGGASMQNSRIQMEDFEYHQPSFVFPTWNLYMVLDGHGGSVCAAQVKEKLPCILSNCIRDDFAKEFEDVVEPENDAVETAIKKAFLKTDDVLRETCKDDSGACCLIVITTPKKIITAWCGDCALFRIDKNFSVERITRDHVPTLEEEKKRIFAANSMVHNGRVDGNINISRAFGDFFFKPLKRERTIIQGGKKRLIEMITLTPETFPIVCIPDVLFFERKETDLGFLACSDGLLKVGFNDAELEWKHEFQDRFMEGYTKPYQLATFLVDYAFQKKSLDNITVSIILNQSVKQSKEKEELFHIYVEKRRQSLLGCVCDSKEEEEECKSCFENGEQAKNIHMEE